MAMHPTFTHAAADLRRQSHLAEAADASRGKLDRQRESRRHLGSWFLRVGDRVVHVIDRVISDFEPHPRPLRPATRRGEA